MNERFHRFINSPARWWGHLFVLNAIVAAGHFVEHLTHDAHRLANFLQANCITVIGIPVHTDHHVEFDFVVVEIRKVFAQVESQASGAQNWASGR